MAALTQVQATPLRENFCCALEFNGYFTILSAHPLPTVIAPWGQNS
jgi:hypothetical protein